MVRNGISLMPEAVELTDIRIVHLVNELKKLKLAIVLLLNDRKVEHLR
jgi:hypothetical protein